MEVHVIIATAGRRLDLLNRTLTSLASCDDVDQLATVHVVENGGDGGCAPVCRAQSANFPIAYTHVPQPGKTAALNRVLHSLRRGLAIFLDDDIRLEPATIRNYLDWTRPQLGFAFYGGPVAAEYELAPPEHIRRAMPKSARGYALAARHPTLEVRRPAFLGSNWAAHVGDLIAAGGFDVSLGLGTAGNSVGDESDMQRRLLKRGLRGIYLRDARVHHHVPAECCQTEWLIARAERSGITHRLIANRRGPLQPFVKGTNLLAASTVYALTSLTGNRYWRLKHQLSRRKLAGFLAPIDSVD